MNNKGFSLVEILAVVAIMGILFGISAQAYSRYIDQSRNKAYLMLVDSAETATNNYSLHFALPTDGTGGVTFSDLFTKEYLERPTDPGNKIKMCKGKVTMKSFYAVVGTGCKEDQALDKYVFNTVICCSNYTYSFEYVKNPEKSCDVVRKKTKLSSCPSGAA